MVYAQHPKPLGIMQESTNYDVAVSGLLYRLSFIIDAVYLSSKK
jgi:hypothetical protein